MVEIKTKALPSSTRCCVPRPCGAREAALMLPIPSQKDLRRIVLHDIR